MRRIMQLSVVIGALLAWLAHATAQRLTGRRSPDPPDSPANHGLPFERMFFRSRDGLTLHGWWIPAENAKGTIVQCHGQNGSMDADLISARLLHNAGYQVFMFDFRAHGLSGGDHVTFGWLEANDLLGALDYLEKQHDIGRVGILGFSMGGVVAMRTALIDPRITCIVADGLIGQMQTTMTRWMHDKGLPKSVAHHLTNLALWLGSRRTGTPLNQINTIRWAHTLADCSLLIIHGEQDHLVSMDEINQLIANAPTETAMWIAPGCKHREALERYPDEYIQRIFRWFSDYLTPPVV